MMHDGVREATKDLREEITLLRARAEILQTIAGFLEESQKEQDQ